MSEENVELVEKWFEAFDRRDVPAIAGMLTEDFELDLSGYSIPDFPDHGVGVEHALSFMATYLRGFDGYTTRITRLFDVGDEVVALFHDSARMPDSEAVVERDPAHIWTIRGGKLHRVRAFTSQRAALEAAGLSE